MAFGGHVFRKWSRVSKPQPTPPKKAPGFSYDRVKVAVSLAGAKKALAGGGKRKPSPAIQKQVRKTFGR